ncbi:MAG: hypothetical protein IKO05_11860 [Selenomonadaceae bacterium]|nr:hypothetical protein [Selenomonadaceae bacterium]
MKCQRCGKELGDVHRNQKYCAVCRREVKRERERNYHREKSALKKLLKAEAEKLNSPAPPKPATCLHCHKKFEPRYRGEKYCSEECYEHSPFRIMCARNPRVLKYFYRLIEED